MSIELASAYVQIIPSLKGASKAISSELGDVEDAIKKSGDKAGSGFSEGLKKAVKVVGAATVATVSATAAELGVIIKKSVDGYADFEQQVGGIETMFKSSSGTMLKYAQEAYRTAGVSANDYMSQATAFSASLLQSLKGDTAKAAEYANMAMIDMSDNSNKFGTMIGDIQHAYQGFAKQNYTMLDNLKLGYGGTKKEMERLLADAQKMPEAMGRKFDLSNYSDVVEAIHVVQQHMGVAGTTIAEATTTITGSLGMLTGAWTNMLANLGASTEMGAISVKQMVANITDSAGYYIENIGGAVARIVGKLPELGKELFNNFRTDLMPKLKTVGVDVIRSFIDGMELAFPGSKATLTSFANNMVATFKPLGSALANLGRELGSALTPAIAAISDRLRGEGTGAISVFTGAIKAATPTIATIATAISKVVEVAAKIPTPILAGASALVGLHAVGNHVPSLLKDINKGFSDGVKHFLDFGNSTNGAATGIKNFRKTADKMFEGFLLAGEKAYQAAGKTDQQISAMSYSAVQAKGAVSLLGATMKSALVSTGIGVAIAVVTAAIKLFVDKIGEAKRAQKAWDDDVKNLAKTLRETGGELSKQQWADYWVTQCDKAKEAGNDWSKSLEKVGGNWAKTLDILSSGNTGTQTAMIEGWRLAVERLDKAIADIEGPIKAAGDSMAGYGVHAGQTGKSITELTNNTNQYAQAQKAAKLNPHTEELKAQRDAYNNLLDAIDPNIRKIQEAQAEEEKSRTATQRYSDAVKGLADALSKAKEAQDRLAGAALSEKEAMFRSEEAMVRVKTAQKELTDAVKKHGEHSDEAREAEIAYHRAIMAAGEATGEYGNAMAYADGNTKRAMATTKNQIVALEQMARAAGFSEREIAGLTEKAQDLSKGLKNNTNDVEANTNAQREAKTALGNSLAAAKQLADQTGFSSKSSEAYTAALRQNQQAAFDVAYAGGLTTEALAITARQAGINRDEFLRMGENAGYSANKLREVAYNASSIPARVNTEITRSGLTAGDYQNIASAADKINGTRNVNVTKTGVSGADLDREYNREVTYTVHVNTSGGGGGAMSSMQQRADGGIVKAFAKGGINTAARIPQIVKGGANILWGEPETGWEAYISGKPSMRLRNLEILEEVARRFGQQLIPLASGGVYDAPVLPTAPSLPGFDLGPLLAEVRSLKTAIINNATATAAGIFDADARALGGTRQSRARTY